MRNKVSMLTRNEIRHIAASYATSADEVSASYYVDKHNVTESVFYHCLEKAVEESIVDLKTAQMIAAKAGRNGARHAGEGARVNSSKHFQRLIDARDNFRFKAFERKKFVKKYAESEKSFKVFCKDECIEPFILGSAIKVAVINEEVNDSIMEKLYQKSVKTHGKEKADSLYDTLKTKRLEHRKTRCANERAKRKAKAEQKEAERMRAEEEAAKLKAEHRRYVQMTFDDYSIPDELEEQKESLGVTEDEE